MKLSNGAVKFSRADMILMSTFLMCGAAIHPALAKQPVAIVEDIRSPTSDVETFQYLRAGKNIDLGRTGRITIGYLKSCFQETITGGQVVVGQQMSKVEGGSVKRVRVECNGGRSNLSAGQAGKSGVMVFRGIGDKEKPGDAGAEKPGDVQPIRVYSASPFFLLSDRVGVVVIKRLDAPGDLIVLGVNGKTLDLAKKGKRLSPGAKYQVSAGDRTQIFEVVRNEPRDGGALIGRLVWF